MPLAHLLALFFVWQLIPMSDKERRQKVLQAAAKNISGRNHRKFMTVTRTRRNGAHIEYYEEKVRRNTSRKQARSD